MTSWCAEQEVNKRHNGVLLHHLEEGRLAHYNWFVDLKGAASLQPVKVRVGEGHILRLEIFQGVKNICFCP